MILTTASTARAHVDPPGCFQTGPAIIVTVFEKGSACTSNTDCAPGVQCLAGFCSPGLVGDVSQCENIRYRATLQKATPSDDSICAFSGGTFSLTTPDGVVHTISSNVPCLGGNTGLEGCVDTQNSLVSDIFDYTVSPANVDPVTHLITATAQYSGGIVHDSANNTGGVSATTPKSTPVVSCDDGDNCTIDLCADPTAHGLAACTHTPVVCDDDNTCTSDACNPANGLCVFTPVGDSTPCADTDGNLCTTAGCEQGSCVQAHVTTVCQPDNNPCTSDLACNPATGTCDHPPVGDSTPCPDTDGNLCTTAGCEQGTCVQAHVTTPCTPDNNPCTSDPECNPATGTCDHPPVADSTPCPDTDGNACTTAGCEQGVCVQPHVETTCNDNNPCTDDSCNPGTGQCEFVDNGTCHPAICRTPGYWKTHGAVSQEVIDHAGGCLEVCGEVITTATADSVGNANSVLEAMCIPVRGEPRLQLARQLTGMALNCVISEFGADCGSDPALSTLFSQCTDACINNTDLVGDCISAIDCFANGGLFDPDTGLCGTDPNGSCHERALPDFVTTQSADTPQACNAASKNTCEVILSNEANCTSGVRSSAPESCP
jgi:slime mold repeat-containing protein